MEDGSQRDLETRHGAEGFKFVNADDSNGFVNFAQCKTIEFLKPARKDKKANAMFDHWKYSPYTGEKLDKDE